MTTSSEDVLLQVSSVKYKKGDGVLYVMNERLAWMAEHKDTVAVSHHFSDIKMQKISPEGKAKVQLQVVLHDGSNSTFHFANRDGTPSQMQDRERVKELLVQLLPNFKRKVNKELEEKNRLLSEHPALLQLYRDLVITQVLTSEEFWNSHASQYTLGKDNIKQDIGVSGAFLADIKPQTDGCNGLKYNLTADVLACIFKTYPAVKKKHTENVPNKMTEGEFWTKFFQSHYFHRDRLTSGTKDIFTECGKIDDNELKADINNSHDPLLELSQFQDNTLEDGYGGPATDTDKAPSSGNIVHQNMIRRFNQHSTMVFKAGSHVRTTTANGPLGNSSLQNGSKVATSNGNKSPSRTSNSMEPSRKKARIQEKITYDDLNEGEKGKATTPLKLTKVDRYLHGPTPGGSDMNTDFVDVQSIISTMVEQTSTWNNRISQRSLVSPTAAVGALGELSPGGALMRGFQEQSLAQLVPTEIENELRALYLAASELLKHFWKAFPPTTPLLEAKAVKMHEALERFHMARLKPFEDKILRELSPIGSSLTQHLNNLLHAATRKLVAWQERKMRQQR